MRYPWANSLLFLFLGLELLTGFFGLISGSEDRSIYLQLHRIGGYGIVTVLVWKTVNVAMSLKWRRIGTGADRVPRADRSAGCHAGTGVRVVMDWTLLLVALQRR